MADIRPIGSEKLKGNDQIRRILEISRYNEPKNEINEGKTDYTIQLADGNTYGIVHEKSGYIVKRSINESDFDYIDRIENRKHYKSYSQAMKKLNLMAGELNRIHENKEGIELLGEKKFVLKTPKSAEAGMSDMGENPTLPPPPQDTGSETPPAPSSDDISDLGLDDLGLDDMKSDDMKSDDMKGDDMESDGDDSFKSIQKLTGKLGQKIRSLDSNEGMSSENIKYVLNSIISAFDLEKLDEEDKDDILSNFEEEEIDYGIEDDLGVNNNADMDIEMGTDDLDMGSDEELNEYDIKKRQHDMNREKYENLRLGSVESVLDEIFEESKVDKVLSKYFVISEEEKVLQEQKQVKNFLMEKVNKNNVIKEIKKLSNSFEQEKMTILTISENTNSNFVGKTNKGNLVVEINGKQLKITEQGEIL